MEWLENAIWRISETEIIDLQDTNTKESVEKILSRKERKKLRKKWVRVSPKKWHSKKVKKDRSVNREHLICKVRNWSNHAHNIKMSDIKAHAWKHAYLWVQLPHEQLKTILEDNFQVLHKETRQMIVEEIEQILEYYIKWEELYEVKCFSDNKHPKK